MSQSRLHYISSLPLYSKKYSKRKVMKPKIWYITIVSLESVENATVLAALTFIVSGALIGAFISISTYVALAINSKRFITRVTRKKLRVIAAILLTIAATPLIIYSAAIHTPDWLHCPHHYVSVPICYA